jgi:hypothetical protein
MTAIKRKPLASLSLDIDNKWSYLKTHGDPGWDSFPSYLDYVIPRILGFLKERNLKITFFVVGRDAALEKNREVLSQIAPAGHEIGNHSFHHEPWLHLYPEKQIEDEIALAEQHIFDATGQGPVGFRGPGFSLSQATLRVLVSRGYLYDASTFPTYLGPLARAYYLATTRELSPQEKEKRKTLFGSLRDGLRPLKPYRWTTDAGTILEIPVTTMPGFKMPIHLSYILYLSGFSHVLAMRYFKAALKFCRLTATEPSLLLHAADFVGCDDCEDLSFFPGMKLSSEKKMEVVREALSALSANFTVLSLCEHARSALQASDLQDVIPDFRHQNLSLAEGLE